MYQVNLELKPDTDKVVTPPVDDVTKYGQSMAIRVDKRDSV